MEVVKAAGETAAFAVPVEDAGEVLAGDAEFGGRVREGNPP